MIESTNHGVSFEIIRHLLYFLIKYLIGRSYKSDEFNWPFLFSDYNCVT